MNPDPLYVPGDELAYSPPHRIPWRWLALALVLLIAWRKL